MGGVQTRHFERKSQRKDDAGFLQQRGSAGTRHGRSAAASDSAGGPSPGRGSISRRTSAGAVRCRRKFLRFFPGGFQDETYIAWERGYKWKAHEEWEELLDRSTFRSLLKERKYREIAAITVGIEARTNLLFSFEKMALRDAVKSLAGARTFATALYEFLHGPGNLEKRFESWIEAVAELPRKQTRVLTWPVVTVVGFIAQPKMHFFLKPNVTRIAAREYGFDFHYESRPSWPVYENLLEFVRVAQRDLRDLRPRDMIDIQSFLWVQGSGEYEE